MLLYFECLRGKVLSEINERREVSMTNSIELISEPVLFHMQEFYCFDNFSAFAITWRGLCWMTVEHAYQAAKFYEHISVLWERIHNAPSAHEAKQIAKTYDHQKRSDWLEVCIPLMEELIWAKLTQHEYVRRKLLQTGERSIIEASPTDLFWGWGPNKDGENHMGKIWMRCRSKLQVECI